MPCVDWLFENIVNYATFVPAALRTLLITCRVPSERVILFPDVVACRPASSSDAFHHFQRWLSMTHSAPSISHRPSAVTAVPVNSTWPGSALRRRESPDHRQLFLVDHLQHVPVSCSSSIGGRHSGCFSWLRRKKPGPSMDLLHRLEVAGSITVIRPSFRVGRGHHGVILPSGSFHEGDARAQVRHARQVGSAIFLRPVEEDHLGPWFAAREAPNFRK